MPIVRSFIYLHTAEGHIFHENQEKDVARLLNAPPSRSIGNYKLLGLQIRDAKIVGIITGTEQQPTVIKFDPLKDRPVAFGGHIFALGEDCTKKRTGNKDIDDFLNYIRTELAANNLVDA